jgi:DNA-directed RNA polymerase subunit RPC12/RpoP
MKLHCPECSQHLNVPEGHDGRRVRCPKCSAIFSIGREPEPRASPKSEGIDPDFPTPPRELETPLSWTLDQDRAPAHQQVLWELKIHDGRVFGPVDRFTLDQWVSEGRVGQESWLRRSTEREWQPAPTIFPYLRTPPSEIHAVSSRGASQRARNTNSNGPVYVEGHRGFTVFLLGLFGFCCVMTAFVAIVMAAVDLPKMKAGTMDPQGEYLTTVGLVLALVSLLLFIYSMYQPFMDILF